MRKIIISSCGLATIASATPVHPIWGALTGLVAGVYFWSREKK